MSVDSRKTIPKETWKHSSFKSEVRAITRVPEAVALAAILATGLVGWVALSYSALNFLEIVVVLFTAGAIIHAGVKPIRGSAIAVMLAVVVFLAGSAGAIPHVMWICALPLLVFALLSVVAYLRVFRVAAVVVYFADHLRAVTGDQRDIQDMFQKLPWVVYSRQPLPLTWSAPLGSLSPEAKGAVTGAAEDCFGVPVKLVSLRADSTSIRETRRVEEPPKDPFKEELNMLVESVLGKEAEIRSITTVEGDSDDWEEIEFGWSPALSARVAEDGRRRKVEQAFASALDARIGITWKTGERRAVVRPIPPLPDKVDHPPRDESTPTDSVRVGLGVGNQMLAWPIETGAPHMIVCGATDNGKTTFIRTVLADLPHEKCDLYFSDPKKYEAFGMDLLPSMKKVGRNADEIAALIQGLVDLMHARLDEAAVKPSAVHDMKYVVCVFDEIMEMSRILDEAGHKKTLGQLWSLVAVGRGVRFRIILVTQQGSADVIPTNARLNCGTNVILGNATPELSKMLFNNSRVATSGLGNVRGRAWIQTYRGGPVAPMQVFWTPPFDVESISADEAEILRGLGIDLAQEPQLPSSETTASLDEEDETSTVGDEGHTSPSSKTHPPAESDLITEQRTPLEASDSQPPSDPPSNEAQGDTTPTLPLDVAEGDTILIDHPEASGQIEVEVSVVEIDADNPELIELEWTASDGVQGVCVVNEDDVVLVVSDQA